MNLRIVKLVMKMGINIGNNNKIKNAIIGNNNNKEKKENTIVRIVLEIIIGLVIAFFVYKFGWN